jgi:hypothetical protein
LTADLYRIRIARPGWIPDRRSAQQCWVMLSGTRKNGHRLIECRAEKAKYSLNGRQKKESNGNGGTDKRRHFKDARMQINPVYAFRVCPCASVAKPPFQSKAAVFAFSSLTTGLNVATVITLSAI